MQHSIHSWGSICACQQQKELLLLDTVNSTSYSTNKFPMDFLTNMVWKTKNQTRLLGLTFIVGQISAAWYNSNVKKDVPLATRWCLWAHCDGVLREFWQTGYAGGWTGRQQYNSANRKAAVQLLLHQDKVQTKTSHMLLVWPDQSSVLNPLGFLI